MEVMIAAVMIGLMLALLAGGVWIGLALMAIGILGMLGGATFGLGWMLFHLLVIPLQAFIFMMLSIVYLSLSEDSH